MIGGEGTSFGDSKPSNCCLIVIAILGVAAIAGIVVGAVCGTGNCSSSSTSTPLPTTAPPPTSTPSPPGQWWGRFPLHGQISGNSMKRELKQCYNLLWLWHIWLGGERGVGCNRDSSTSIFLNNIEQMVERPSKVSLYYVPVFVINYEYRPEKNVLILVLEENQYFLLRITEGWNIMHVNLCWRDVLIIKSSWWSSWVLMSMIRLYFVSTVK